MPERTTGGLKEPGAPGTQSNGSGENKKNGQEEIVHPENMNIAYDQVRPDGEDGHSVDKLQLQIPSLSRIPVTNLNVERAEIEFASEIHSSTDKDEKIKINGHICSPEQRDSDFLPRVSYKIEVKSIPATEGILRLADSLSTSQIAKQLDATPVNVDGNLSDDAQENSNLETGGSLCQKKNNLLG